MKATKRAAFAMRIASMLVCAMVLVYAMPKYAAPSASAEELPAMILEEIDRWDEDGWKIEKTSGTLEVDGVEHAYDYVLTISDQIWVVNSGTDVMKIGNVSSRKIELNVTTSTGIQVSGNPDITKSSWYSFSTTDATIGEFDNYNSKTNGRYLVIDPKETAGQAVLTWTLDKVYPNDGDEANPQWAGQAAQGELRILYNCVSRETEKFTFTGAEKDRNGNRNAVWLNGINIPEAGDEWTKAEEAGGLLEEFYGYIYYLEGNEDGTPQDISNAQSGVNDLYTLMTTNKTAGSLKFQTEVRSDHIELKKLVRTLDNAPNVEENGTPVDFEEGDAIYLKAGLYLLGQDGNHNWALNEKGFVYTELLRDQYFVYLGEEQGWSADQLGMSIAFTETSVSVDAGSTLKLTPVVSGGEALPEDQKVVTWTSADEAIATVAQDGTVSGIAEGTTTITATTGTGDSASIEVRVVATDSITSIRLNATTINLNIGGTRQITATVEGGSTADKTVTWTSSDPEIATVSDAGLVTAVAPGTCTITATASDGKTATATVNVRQGTVEPDPDPDPDPDPNTDSCESCESMSLAKAGGMGAIAIVIAACGLLFVRRRKDQD